MNIPATTAFALISRWMNEVVRGKLAAWRVESGIWRLSIRSHKDAQGTLYALKTIWGALAEPVRFENDVTQQLAHRAAREWLALPHDDIAARAAYLDHWIHDELGFRRKRPGMTADAAPRQSRAKIKSPLIARLPKNGHDAAAARELVALGYPALAPVLPHLFRWLETSGSDVELVLRPFFSELGAPARDLACDALLQRNKPALKHCLLRHVLPGWPRDVLLTLPLERYLYDGDAYGLDVWALKLMTEHCIPTHDGLKGLAEARERKIQHLNMLLGVLEDLDPPTGFPAL